MRWICCFLVGCLFLGWPVATFAQGPPRVVAPAEIEPVNLGESAANLYGPWRFQVGDDPAWAQPDFDDRSWESVDLHSPEGADPDLGTSGFVPGWTSQGHSTHSGYAWYRLRLNVQGARTALSLKMPDSFDDAYQVFVNGQKVGEFGKFTAHGVKAYAAQPRGFKFPKALRSGPMTIAIRMWMDSSTRFNAPDAGGLHGPPVLGLAPTVATQVKLDWDDYAHVVGSGFLEMLVLLLALAVALTHLWLDRGDKAYLWLGLVSLATLLGNLVVLALNFTTLMAQTHAVFLRYVVFTPVRTGLWILFWASWFGLGPPRWLQRTVWCLVVLFGAAAALLQPPLHGQALPLSADHAIHQGVLGMQWCLCALLIWVTVQGMRKDRPEGLLALPAVLLAIAANYQDELRLLHLPMRFVVFKFAISLGQASTMLSLLLVTAMASRRFLSSQRRKVLYEVEVQQAGELQKVIFPSTLPQVPGLRIEGDYRPSREVGGDFFQIIPHHKDGSVLVVVGDVTGKGLRAGMLVALIVGVIDTAARETPDPEHLLLMMNDRLCERGYATATCLVMKITADGYVTIANAGHLPPYLNGRELPMEGALPLGTLAGIDYTTMCVQLHDGDSMMLLTDGVVEAQDEKGKLFGFDRIEAMIAGHASAREVADAAQRFGQEDDILVLCLERTAVGRLRAAAA